jgi:ribonucleoside-diphosphate reductase alpha chain
MQHGTSSAARAAAIHPGLRNGKALTPEEMSAGWTCVKRDGQAVPFDPDKIRRALSRCFHSIRADAGGPSSLVPGAGEEQALIEQITRAVCNNLAAQGITRPGVEEVQRLVIQQLWGAGLFEAAEQYQNYREERRRARELRPIPPEVAARFLEDRKHFPTDLQYYQFMGKFSRWRDQDGRRETWREAVYERVIPWFQRLPLVAGKLSAAEWDELADAMYRLEVSPALRVVQMAGPALDRCHVGVYNCLRRDTRFWTRDGVRSFLDFADGDTVDVLTHMGNWRTATVRCYGRDVTYPIVLARGLERHVVHATRDHRWLGQDGNVLPWIVAGDKLCPAPAEAVSLAADAGGTDAASLPPLVLEVGSHGEDTDVWCLEVPGEQSFVLDGCIVTGNCAYQPMADIFSFPEMLYILMQGTGVGFSVESDYVGELPRVKKQRGKKADVLAVTDSTEGWCTAYFEALQRWFDGHDVRFDVSGVRPAGSRLRTKGGLASGPGPFLELMEFSRNVILARQGRYLDDTDAHRLACFTGRIVQVGGVRRAATLSLSDLASAGMRDIKSGDWYNDRTYWTDGKYLTMANNSAVYEERPPIDVFLREWLALLNSRSGERGIYNRQAAVNHRPARRRKARFGVNPCAEVILRPYEFCNLSIAVARPDDTVDSLKRKVRLATLFGLMQSTCTQFQYIRPDWKKNCEEERLLGVDITGHADCPLLHHGAAGLAELQRALRQVVHDTKAQYAPRFGIALSAADTCIKPGGDSSIFFDCAAGISPRFAPYQVRWVRERKDSAIARFLIDSGVPHAPAPEAPGELLVFGFPKAAPAGAITRDDLTAVQQLENWLSWKKNYAEHSVSATIYIDADEWLEVGAWVYRQEHWDHITGLSFLPKDNGRYTYAPNEELTRAQYDEFVASFPTLNWAKLVHYEQEDSASPVRSWACTGDRCEL